MGTDSPGERFSLTQNLLNQSIQKIIPVTTNASMAILVSPISCFVRKERKRGQAVFFLLCSFYPFYQFFNFFLLDIFQSCADLFNNLGCKIATYVAANSYPAAYISPAPVVSTALASYAGILYLVLSCLT